MRPPQRSNITQFERVPQYEEWLRATITEVKLEENHKFSFQGKDTLQDGVRFQFAIEGCKHPHYSRWMKYNYSEKANLYKKFLLSLVENAEPDMQFDLDRFQNLPVKLMFSQNGEFDNLERVKPDGAKLLRTKSSVVDDDTSVEAAPDEDPNEIPF